MHIEAKKDEVAVRGERTRAFALTEARAKRGIKRLTASISEIRERRLQALEQHVAESSCARSYYSVSRYSRLFRCRRMDLNDTA